MVEISLSGSGEGSGWATAPGYSTAVFSARPISIVLTSSPQMRHISLVPGLFPGSGAGKRHRDLRETRGKTWFH